MGISGLLRVFLSTIRLLSDENFRAEYFLDQESETDFNNKSHSEKNTAIFLNFLNIHF